MAKLKNKPVAKPKLDYRIIIFLSVLVVVIGVLIGMDLYNKNREYKFYLYMEENTKSYNFTPMTNYKVDGQPNIKIYSGINNEGKDEYYYLFDSRKVSGEYLNKDRGAFIRISPIDGSEDTILKVPFGNYTYGKLSDFFGYKNGDTFSMSLVPDIKTPQTGLPTITIEFILYVNHENNG